MIVSASWLFNPVDRHTNVSELMLLIRDYRRKPGIGNKSLPFITKTSRVLLGAQVYKQTHTPTPCFVKLIGAVENEQGQNSDTTIKGFESRTFRFPVELFNQRNKCV